MNDLMMLFIFVIWLFSIYAFANWRLRSKTQNGGIWVSALHDRPTDLFVMGTGVILLLVLILHLI